MSDKPHRKPPTSKHFRVLEVIEDQDELDRLSALSVDDGGAGIVVGEACSVLMSRERNGKPASAVPMILGLLELLTPNSKPTSLAVCLHS